VVSLCQMAAVRARRRCRTRAQTPGLVRPPWAFEIELGLEGLVDRLDDLAERGEQMLARSGLGGAEGGCPDEGDAGVGEFGFEAGTPVALVGHEDLAGAV
jgi:hypothetical protein